MHWNILAAVEHPQRLCHSHLRALMGDAAYLAVLAQDTGQAVALARAVCAGVVVPHAMITGVLAAGRAHGDGPAASWAQAEAARMLAACGAKAARCVASTD